MIPKIEWGPSYSKTLTFSTPLDEYSTYSRQREGGQVVTTVSGQDYGWTFGVDYYLEGTLRFIPSYAQDGVTGYDDVDGVRDFLNWAQWMNRFRFYPDRNESGFYLSYLVYPFTELPTRESNQMHRVRLTIRNNTAPYTEY